MFQRIQIAQIEYTDQYSGFMVGTIAVHTVSILKEDGCNTNVISRSIVKRYENELRIKAVDTEISSRQHRLFYFFYDLYENYDRRQ